MDLDLEEFAARHQLSKKERSLLTVDALAEFNEAFTMFDVDADGAVTVEEVIEILSKGKSTLSISDAKMMIAAADKNHNGSLDHEEFVLMMVKAQDPDSEVMEAFCRFDTDKSGYIDFNELKALLGDRLTEAQIAATIAEHDTDKDGKISFFEFQTMLNKKAGQ